MKNFTCITEKSSSRFFFYFSMHSSSNKVDIENLRRIESRESNPQSYNNNSKRLTATQWL